jgi:hypothetical protein
MGLDEELCDILEDGVGDLVLDEEGAAVDRKKHTLQTYDTVDYLVHLWL